MNVDREATKTWINKLNLTKWKANRCHWTIRIDWLLSIKWWRTFTNRFRSRPIVAINFVNLFDVCVCALARHTATLAIKWIDNAIDIEPNVYFVTTIKLNNKCPIHRTSNTQFVRNGATLDPDFTIHIYFLHFQKLRTNKWTLLAILPPFTRPTKLPSTPAPNSEFTHEGK